MSLGTANDAWSGRQPPYEERNQTPRALKRIRNLARRSGLPEALVSAVVSRKWNYDNENFCWVPKEQENDVPESAIAQLEEGLQWPRDLVVSRNHIVERSMAFADAGLTPHISRFLGGVPAQNPWAISPIATAATLNGLSAEVLSLCVVPERVGFWEACSYAACKLGTFLTPHSDLGFAVFEEHTLSLGTPPKADDGAWLAEVCAAISALPVGSKLTDLVKVSSAALGGNKATRRVVLEALAIVGVLRTDEFEPGVDFLPAVAKDSTHFYSNEWRFPMNFWAESGHVAGPQVLLDQG